MQLLQRQLHLLTDETRFEILRALMEHDLCVGALARHLRISSAAVSQHLRMLQDEGFVKGEKRGYWTHYGVEKEKIIGLADELKQLVAGVSRKPYACRKGKSCTGKEISCCLSPPGKQHKGSESD